MGWGSQIRDPEKTIADPGVKEAPDPVSATLSEFPNLHSVSKDKNERAYGLRVFLKMLRNVSISISQAV
jgi:hypothetical protein